jgi:L-alanine-DL-glutamate epimerase-like enolase superfamily enzyme
MIPMAERRNDSIQALSRRSFLSAGLTGASALWGLCEGDPAEKRMENTSAAVRSSDIQVLDIRREFEEYKYRAPYQFGGRTVDRVTLLNIYTRVKTRSGREARGFGSMPLGNAWSFPSTVVGYDQSLEAMKQLAVEIERITAAHRSPAHPVDIYFEAEPSYFSAAETVSGRMELREPIPKLCTLVTASPFDAAIHDAFAKANGISCYQGYGSHYMSHDLSHYLGDGFKGEFLEQYVRKQPAQSVFLYHSIGASDPIFESDIRHRVGDGLPETLKEWTEADGLTHFKIKLNGGNLKADVDRVVGIERAVAEAQEARGVKEWTYCCDFNEGCKNVEYLLEFLEGVKQQAPEAIRRLQYIEQPTSRDLKADSQNVMHQAARIVPVVIDEALVDLESFHLSRRMGYSGVALKACKGQTNALLMAAAGQKFKSFLCVQDLTCPGASLIQSAGLAAHIPGVFTIEANSRQYVPAANQAWTEKFPSLFKIHDGRLGTGVLTGLGLGAV